MISTFVKTAVRSAVSHNRLLLLTQKANFCIKSETHKRNRQSVRYYSKNIDRGTTGPTDDVAEEFFDEDLEKDLEFLDLASATQGVGLGNLAIQKAKDVLSWEEIAKKDADPFNLDAKISTEQEAAPAVTDKIDEWDAENEYDENEAEFGKESELFGPSTFEDDFIKSSDAETRDQRFVDHIKSFERNLDPDRDYGGNSAPFIPPGMLNYNLPWRKEEEFPDPSLEEFVPSTSPDKFRFDQQGFRACPGQLQRTGKPGNWKNELRCHKIDLDALHYLDVLTLQRFMRNDAEIMNRKETGLCAKCQRRVAKTIKRARNFALLPHLGDYSIEDAAADREDGEYHTAVKGSSRVVSKSVLK